MNISIKICVLAAASILTGCAHHLQLQVIDASAATPIPNVDVQVRERNSFSYFEHEPHQHAVGVTDTNGLLTVRSIGSKDVLYFNATGYRGATAGFVGRAKIGINPYPPQNVDTMYLEQKVVDYKGIIVIPLKPLNKD